MTKLPQSGVLPLLLILSLSGCAPKASQTPVSVCVLPSRFLLPIDSPVLMGTSNADLLMWGLAQAEQIRVANVRLDGARKYKEEKCDATRD